MTLMKMLYYEEWKEKQVNQGQKDLKWYPQVILLDKATVSLFATTKEEPQWECYEKVTNTKEVGLKLTFF